MDPLLFVKTLFLGLAVAARLGPIGALVSTGRLSAALSPALPADLARRWRTGVYATLAAAGFAAFSTALGMIDMPLRLIGGAFMLWLGWKSMRPHPPRTAATIPPAT